MSRWLTEMRLSRITVDRAEVRQMNEIGGGWWLMCMVFQIDTLVQDAFEIVLLIRSWNNSLAPINRIPPEILALLPDFWDKDHKDQGTIGLTHVCRVWREIFLSRSSLWANFDCKNEDKTRVYLERSKSSPIHVSLDRGGIMFPNDPFLQIMPHTIGRLKSLSINGRPENLRNIISHLSLPAPLLEDLSIDGGSKYSSRHNSVLVPTLFNGDLSSLRVLRLQCIRTELPWRNMINLTSFTLRHTPPENTATRHLLDFFESAPRLREIQLLSATPTSGAQFGRLVSLACLRKMEITGDEPSGHLLDHLLIPVGAELVRRTRSFSGRIEAHLPKSLDNLMNLPNFTQIHLHVDEPPARSMWIQFSGPNGQLCLEGSSRDNYFVIASLTLFDTSNTEQLEIIGNHHLTSGPLFNVFSTMENLRTLTLSRVEGLHHFTTILHNLCLKLEELVLVPSTGKKGFDIGCVIEMAAARERRRLKLRTVRIVDGQDEVNSRSVLKLGKYVLHVHIERRPTVSVINGGGGGSCGGG